VLRWLEEGETPAAIFERTYPVEARAS